ncbi:hypothetical protein MUN84_03800 [Hymenobacter sp. 5516J-16]|uniref:hypothetical protein n=1 Tax=Hymenobacter sp. 5516J-16 TaxID=2932253 RepID=UPI001FD3723C|nr:hypothetical protein [Hymenobacter sp. 5516J-16]UOQ77796.1 hypothetical protein MUN84_03800 [Hymenobacter sp. 5516J-16]
MYATLLLSEDYFSWIISLFKALVIATLYGLALFFLFYKARTSELKPIGVGLGFLLAFIGIRSLSKEYSWEQYTFGDYFLLLFLCLPLLAAGAVYFSLRNSSKE